MWSPSWVPGKAWLVLRAAMGEAFPEELRQQSPQLGDWTVILTRQAAWLLLLIRQHPAVLAEARVHGSQGAWARGRGTSGRCALVTRGSSMPGCVLTLLLPDPCLPRADPGHVLAGRGCRAGSSSRGPLRCFGAEGRGAQGHCPVGPRPRTPCARRSILTPSQRGPKSWTGEWLPKVAQQGPGVPRGSAASGSKHAPRQSVSDGTSRRARNMRFWQRGRHSGPQRLTQGPHPGLGRQRGPLALAGLAPPSAPSRPCLTPRGCSAPRGCFLPISTPRGCSPGARSPGESHVLEPLARGSFALGPWTPSPPSSGVAAGCSEAERRMNTCVVHMRHFTERPRTRNRLAITEAGESAVWTAGRRPRRAQGPGGAAGRRIPSRSGSLAFGPSQAFSWSGAAHHPEGVICSGASESGLRANLTAKRPPTSSCGRSPSVSPLPGPPGPPQPPIALPLGILSIL